MDDDTSPLPDPKEFLVRKPKKSILKTTSSFDRERKEISPTREAHFDEMNILQTYHPQDKDYGHIKIDEPKTPYNNYSDSEAEEGPSEGVRRVSISEPVCIEFEPGELNDIVAKKRSENPKIIASDVDNDTDEDDLTEEQKERRRQFELKRKQHYNEFQAVKLAKQLLAQEENESCDDDTSSSMPGCSSRFVPSSGSLSSDPTQQSQGGSSSGPDVSATNFKTIAADSLSNEKSGGGGNRSALAAAVGSGGSSSHDDDNMQQHFNNNDHQASSSSRITTAIRSLNDDSDAIITDDDNNRFKPTR